MKHILENMLNKVIMNKKLKINKEEPGLVNNQETDNNNPKEDNNNKE